MANLSSNSSLFDKSQIEALTILERFGGSLSLLAVTLIFLAYARLRRLRTIANTFIVFASISNAVASVAMVISYAGLQEGTASPLCQAQGFLIEM